MTVDTMSNCMVLEFIGPGSHGFGQIKNYSSVTRKRVALVRVLVNEFEFKLCFNVPIIDFTVGMMVGEGG